MGGDMPGSMPASSQSRCASPPSQPAPVTSKAPYPSPTGVDYPHPSSAAAQAVMRGNRRVDTRPERQVRSLLQRHGYRFRKDYLIRAADLRVRPDVVFTRQRVAVFPSGP